MAVFSNSDSFNVFLLPIIFAVVFVFVRLNFTYILKVFKF